MIKIIYKKLPINEITYLNREKDGFSAEGAEKNFYNSLKASISKHGIKDPVYIEYGSKAYGDVLKIIVGNGLYKVRCVMNEI